MSTKKVMLVGGGSGGHLTPIVAVADAIKNIDTEISVIHIGQKGEGLHEATKSDSIDKSYAITAGKFRRYHGESFLSHLLDVKTLLLNVRDFFRFMYGTIEAWRLLGKLHPDSIMLKGGFVSVPVGYAARLRRIPYITHDSDAVPGLANRLTAKHAVYNTTALPAEIYPYDQNKAIQVGIPIRREFQEVLFEDIAKYKKEINVDPNQIVIFSVGGGLGAQRVNQALAQASKSILAHNSNYTIFHLTGKKLFSETVELYKSKLNETEMERVKLIDFTNELYKYSAAADLVITRAGATNIAEFAAQAKICIVVPNPVLTGGQQLHNANILENESAAIILQENDLNDLDKTVIDVLNSPKENRQKIASALKKLAVYDSSEKIATLLVEIGTKQKLD